LDFRSVWRRSAVFEHAPDVIRDVRGSEFVMRHEDLRPVPDDDNLSNVVADDGRPTTND
jgi:hypothetical protein